jgi:hypothetical protein
VSWDAWAEQDVYRHHACPVLSDRRWRPGAGDYVPPQQRKAIERRRAKTSEAMPVGQAIPPKEKLLETLGE